MWCPRCCDGGAGHFTKVKILSSGRYFYCCIECETIWFENSYFKYDELQGLFPFLEQNNISYSELDFTPYVITEGDTELHNRIRSFGIRGLCRDVSEMDLYELEKLINNQPDLLYKPNIHQVTPLHLALPMSPVVVYELLLKYYTNLNFVDETGDTLMHTLALDNDCKTADEIYKRGAPVDFRNIYGFTPLHVATYFNHIEMVKYLMSIHVNTGLRDNCNKTPLEMAEYFEHEEIIQILCK